MGDAPAKSQVDLGDSRKDPRQAWRGDRDSQESWAETDPPWETTEDKREKQMEEDESFRIGGQQPRSQIPQ